LLNEIDYVQLNIAFMTAIEFSKELIGLEDSMERFARYLTYNTEEAKDLLQDTYLKALSYRDKFVEFTNLKAWTLTIMKNTFINNYRKSVRENAAFDNSETVFLLNNSAESQLSRPESEFIYKEINNDIDSLADEFKIPFRMHTEGYKYNEIADNLNLKIGTVKSRIFFARKKLMESLHDYQ
jgi:RNA polymerase sigma factor (sigma-70 family)